MAVFAAGLSLANAVEPANCRMVNAKGEAGHAAKAIIGQEIRRLFIRSTVDCKPKGDKVICYAQGTACK